MAAGRVRRAVATACRAARASAFSSSSSARSATSSCSAEGSSVATARWKAKPGPREARARRACRGCGRPRRTPRRRRPSRRASRRARRGLARALGQASGEQVRRRGRGDQRARRDACRSARAPSTRRRRDRLLVRADRLVLGAVVAGELADERSATSGGTRPTNAAGELARGRAESGAPRPRAPRATTRRRPPRRARPRTAGAPRAGRAGRSAAARASRAMRTTPRTSGSRSDRGRQPGLRPDADVDAAVGRAHRSRPRGRAEHAAGRCAAPCRRASFSVGSLIESPDPIRSMQCSKERTRKVEVVLWIRSSCACTVSDTSSSGRVPSGKKPYATVPKASRRKCEFVKPALIDGQHQRAGLDRSRRTRGACRAAACRSASACRPRAAPRRARARRRGRRGRRGTRPGAPPAPCRAARGSRARARRCAGNHVERVGGADHRRRDRRAARAGRASPAARGASSAARAMRSAIESSPGTSASSSSVSSGGGSPLGRCAARRSSAGASRTSALSPTRGHRRVPGDARAHARVTGIVVFSRAEQVHDVGRRQHEAVARLVERVVGAQVGPLRDDERQADARRRRPPRPPRRSARGRRSGRMPLRAISANASTLQTVWHFMSSAPRPQR